MSREMQRSAPGSDRYEPLPGIAGIPGWVWRRLPRAAKVAVGLFPLAIIGLVILLGPGIDRSKDERRQAEAERQARADAARVARLRAEQRPRFARGGAAGADLGARAALLQEATAAVASDARQRVANGALTGPIRRVACEPYPRSRENRGAQFDARRDSGSYACLAITREVPRSARNEAAALGHPYRVQVDFTTGRYAFCKVTGRAGEGSIGIAPTVTVPRACR